MADTELVSYSWCQRTGGELTPTQRRALTVRTLVSFADFGRRLAVMPFRRPTAPVEFPAAPDSALTRAAVEAAADQGEHWLAHGFRTWLFGGALAANDGVPLDPELFHVAAIAHDAGIGTPVDGQDFTLRSADAAVRAFALGERPLSPENETALRDGIVAHATPGLRSDETAIGYYLQVGALTDLAGLRVGDLPRDDVRRVYDAHPVTASRQVFTQAIAAEAKAVPRGRFALIHRLGLGLAVRASPTRRHDRPI